MLSKYILTAAMAAGALAAPVEKRAVQVVDVIDVVTLTVTEGHIPPHPTATHSAGGFLEGHSKPAPPAPVTTSTSVAPPPPPPTTTSTPVVVPVTTPEPASTSVAAPVPVPAPSEAPSSSGSGSSSSSSSGNDLLDVVNKWRGKYNLNDLSWDDQLANQAGTVGQNGGGVNEIHALIPGLNMGQVITPGQQNPVPANQQGFSPFEVAYVAWLCEVATDPQLQASDNDGVSACSLVQEVLHMEYSDIGHHQILVSPEWKSVGCKFTANPSANQQTDTYQGLWVCNYSA